MLIVNINGENHALRHYTTLVSKNTVVVLSEVYFDLNIKWAECEHVEPRTTERELSERTVVMIVDSLYKHPVVS